MSVDTLQNFEAKMIENVACGSEVQHDEVLRVETEMNARAKSWGRIVGLCEAWKSDDRVKQALTSTSGRPPPIYGLPKDHKSVSEGQEHPLRPVCGANNGPGARLSDLLAQIISPCNNMAGSDWVDSTEDLQAQIQSFNALPRNERSSMVAFSMDAKALFPSIEIERSAEVVFDLLLESDIEYRNISDEEMTRYAAVVLDQSVIQKHGLQEYIMRRKSRFGIKPTIAAREMNDAWKPNSSSWIKPSQPMDDLIRRKLLSVLVSEEIKFVMTMNWMKILV